MRNFPDWMHKKLICSPKINKTKEILAKYRLNTVCQSANCPNIWECFSKKTATFMILGKYCTRNCGFCAVKNAETEKVDLAEPKRIGHACKELGIKYAVVTSVTRDDLKDKGAGQYKRTIEELKKITPRIRVEVLVPDFMGKKVLFEHVAESKPDVFSHNIETVPRLYKNVRKGASYRRSLNVLRCAKNLGLTTKSSVFVGIGERKDEILRTIMDIRDTGCDMLTIGQYLKPAKGKREVKKYYKPKEFEIFKEMGYKIGFKRVESGPFVRSSFNACGMFKKLKAEGKAR